MTDDYIVASATQVEVETRQSMSQETFGNALANYEAGCGVTSDIEMDEHPREQRTTSQVNENSTIIPKSLSDTTLSQIAAEETTDEDIPESEAIDGRIAEVIHTEETFLETHEATLDAADDAEQTPTQSVVVGSSEPLSDLQTPNTSVASVAPAPQVLRMPCHKVTPDQRPDPLSPTLIEPIDDIKFRKCLYIELPGSDVFPIRGDFFYEIQLFCDKYGLPIPTSITADRKKYLLLYDVTGFANIDRYNKLALLDAIEHGFHIVLLRGHSDQEIARTQLTFNFEPRAMSAREVAFWKARDNEEFAAKHRNPLGRGIPGVACKYETSIAMILPVTDNGIEPCLLSKYALIPIFLKGFC